jgi:PEP-CTERM motif-containing protein
MGRWFGVIAGAAVAGAMLGAAGAAKATPFFFNVTGGCSEACAANAIITPGAGSLTVVLNDTEANPRSAGDLLSGIEIIPSGSDGTPTLTTQAGSLINVTPGANVGTPVAGSPTHWGVAASKGQIVLVTAGGFAEGGPPINMIIGPAPFTNSNASIGNFNPYIDGTGTFTIADTAITAATTITGVTFDFGTTPDTFLPGSVCTPGSANCGTSPPSVPEPSTMALLGTALATLGLLWRPRKSL